MRDTRILSVVIHHDGDAKRLPRLLQSLARQSVGQQRLELALVMDERDEASLEAARRWRHILGCARFLILPRPAREMLAALNEAAALSTGEGILFLNSLCRLAPSCIHSCLDALEANPRAGVIYTSRLAASGLYAVARFSHRELRRRNMVGRVALMRRTAFEETDGLRTNTAHAFWDLWVQAAARGWEFARVLRALYSQDATPLYRGDDERDKALLVINNPGYFDEQVVCWALGILREEAWPRPTGHGTVPDPEDIRAMVEDYVVALRNLTAPTREQRQTSSGNRLDRARRVLGMAS